MRPLLEYCDSDWDNCSSDSKKQLESIHAEDARIITDATKLCSIEKLFNDLGWETLQSRRNKHKLVLLYIVLHGLAPNYLSELAPLYKKLQPIISVILTIFKIIEPTLTSLITHFFHHQFVHGMIYLMIFKTHLLMPLSNTN